MSARSTGRGIQLRAGLAGRLAVIALGCSLIQASTAAAAATWLAPSKLSGAGLDAEAPQVSVDAQGDALSAWGRGGVIEASDRPAGGPAWQTALALSDAKKEAFGPQAALDGRGDAVVAWESREGGEYAVEASTRTGLTGAWQTPVVVKKLGTEPTMDARPDLAVNAAGEAVLVWMRLHSTERAVESSARTLGGSWQKPETLSETPEDQHPAEVGIDAAGNATAVWEDKRTGEVLTTGATRPAGGKWQAPVSISKPGGNANEPRVAVDASGDAVAVWERFEGEELIEASAKPAGAGWGESVALSKPESGKGEPAGQQVAIDDHGDAVAVWSRTNGGHDFIEASVGRAPSSTWQPPVAISGPGGNVEEGPAIGVDGNGNAVATWERLSGGNEVIEAASGLAASGSWQPPVQLSEGGQEAGEPQVALDSQGNAAAVWRRFDGKASYLAEAAGLDAAGPQLNSPAIPVAGAVGQPLAFSTIPFDVWSAIGPTSWSFGDGSSASGTAVTHAYGAPGLYTATVTSSDVLGNATTASGSVSIAAPIATSIQRSVPSVPARVALTLTGARLSASRFRIAKMPTAIAAKAKVPQGTSFRFTLSQAAKVKIEFTRSAKGLRAGGRCLAPSARLRSRHAKRCTRTLSAGPALTRANERAGADSIAFSGRLGSKPLAPGAYEAILSASAAGLSSAPVKLSLTLVR
jgi:hypothetical protein